MGCYQDAQLGVQTACMWAARQAHLNMLAHLNTLAQEVCIKASVHKEARGQAIKPKQTTSLFMVTLVKQQSMNVSNSCFIVSHPSTAPEVWVVR